MLYPTEENRNTSHLEVYSLYITTRGWLCLYVHIACIFFVRYVMERKPIDYTFKNFVDINVTSQSH